jgi:S-adenosylmethionine synthetase
MFGYATLETPELMPAPIQYAHAILRRLAEARKSGAEPTLGPDAKSQLTLRYADGKPVEVTSIVLSTQHTSKRQTSKVIRKIVEPYPRGPARGLDHPEDRMAREPDGDLRDRRAGRRRGPDGPQDHRRHLWRRGPPRRRRVLGQGPDQGRPLGRLCRALSGQERGGRRLAERCTLQVSYAIGVAKPLSIYVDTHGTGQVEARSGDREGRGRGDGPDAARHPHPSGPEPPIYARTSAYGHFGRAPEADGGFSWERTDLVEALKKAV